MASTQLPLSGGASDHGAATGKLAGVASAPAVTPLLSFENGVYRTAPGKIARLARLSPSLAFYPSFASIVWRAGALAKRSGYTDEDWSKSSLEVLRALERVGVQFEITGADQFAGLDGPFLAVGNHMSTLETAVLPVVIQPKKHVTFVVKSSLLDYPVFKHVMRSRDPIAVSQSNPRHDLKTMLTEGTARLERGTSIVVFPQGSRRPAFDPADFNTIGVKLAHRTGVPIVPLALMTDAWPLGRRISDFGRIDPTKKVRFAFGEPMWVRGRGTEEHQAVIDFISRKLRGWAEEEGRR